MNVSFTQITSEANLSKSFYVEDGVIKSVATAQLYAGKCTHQDMQFCEVRDFFATQTNKQATIYGNFDVAKYGNEAFITTNANYKNTGNVITRSKKFFTYSDSPGICMFDYDADDKPISFDKFMARMHMADSQLNDLEHIYYPSVSARIKSNFTNAKKHGFHWYIPVNKASDIPRIGNILFKRLALKGFGYLKHTKSGALVLRTIIDNAVFSPERLDFTGKPICGNGIQCSDDSIEYESGKVLDTSLILDLTKDEISEFDERLKRAKVGRKKQTICLSGDQQIHLSNGEVITVEKIIAQPDKYNDVACADPFEGVDYGRSTAKIYANNGVPVIHTFAHGENRIYQMANSADKHTVFLETGKLSEAIVAVATFLCKHNYYNNGALVSIADGNIKSTTTYSLLFELSKYFIFIAKEKVCDVDLFFCRQLIENLAQLPIPMLTFASKIPLISLDGNVHVEPGYVPSVKGYFIIDEGANYVASVNIEQSNELLFDIIKTFSFDTQQDKSIFFCALFSFFIRPFIKNCPLFLIDSPVMGSGKTLLANLISHIVFADDAPMFSFSKDENENIKLLNGLLIRSQGYIVLDNIAASLKSSYLCTVLTQKSLLIRPLGGSTVLNVQNNSVILGTGNNIIVEGDLIRRTLFCRLNTRSERPFNRVFESSPVDFVINNRDSIIGAILFVLKEAVKLNCKGSMGSFEQWHSVMKGAMQLMHLNDPVLSLENKLNENEDLLELQTFIKFMHTVPATIDITCFTVTDLIRTINLYKVDTLEMLNFYDFLFEIAPGKNAIEPRSVGKFLAQHVDIVCDGQFLYKHSVHSRIINWGIKAGL